MIHDSRIKFYEERRQTGLLSPFLNRKSKFINLGRKPRGFSLVEVVVAAAIIGIGIAGITSAFTSYTRASQAAIPQAQAAFLAEEGLEAALIMRDTTWSGTLGTNSINTPYLLVWSAGIWATTTTKTQIDGTFYRTITFGSVGRNGSDQIVTSGGTNDPNTRLVTSSVSWWNGNATSTVTLVAYVSNLFSN